MACNINVNDISKTRLTTYSQWRRWCNPLTDGSSAWTHLLGHSTADMRDVRLFLQPLTVYKTSLRVQLNSRRSSDEGGCAELISLLIKDSFHVLKTTDEAPRCACTEFSFPCSCMPSVHACWMAKQTDDSAEKFSVFDFAHLTQRLTVSAWVFCIVFSPSSTLLLCSSVFLDW